VKVEKRWKPAATPSQRNDHAKAANPNEINDLGELR
jgi:hypothetical protein